MNQGRAINRRWIDDRLNLLDMKKHELAAAMAIAPPRLSELLRGKKMLRASEANAMAIALRAPVTQIFNVFGIGQLRQTYGTLAITGYIDASSGVIIERTGMESGVLDEIDAPFPGYGGMVARVKGNSMAPRFRDGEVVGFTPDGHDVGRLVGSEVVVCTEDGRMLLKILAKGTEPDRYTLLSLNRDEELIHNVAIAWAAPLDWHIPSRS